MARTCNTDFNRKRQKLRLNDNVCDKPASAQICYTDLEPKAPNTEIKSACNALVGSGPDHIKSINTAMRAVPL